MRVYRKTWTNMAIGITHHVALVDRLGPLIQLLRSFATASGLGIV
jgi:hypothetical protein